MGDGWGNGRYVAAAVSRITMRADVKSVLCESPVSLVIELTSRECAVVCAVANTVCCRSQTVLGRQMRK